MMTESDVPNHVQKSLLHKLVAEMVGTYLLIFTGCASMMVNLGNDKAVTHFCISIVWALSVMVLVYFIGHISGAHLNPAVTIGYASAKRFPLKQVPGYIVAQVAGSCLASGTLRLIFRGKDEHFAGTLPATSHLQAFLLEFIITFYLMLVISRVTDNGVIDDFAGLLVGITVFVNMMMARPITGASMNPARSLGPAILHHEYRGIWIYLVSPTLGAVAGAWTYNVMRYTNKPAEITRIPLSSEPLGKLLISDQIQ